MLDDLARRGEALVAAAAAEDRDTVRRLTEAFVSGALVDEAIPYWERAVGDSFVAYTLARYRKIRGDRVGAEGLYRSGADIDAGCAYGLGVLLQEDGNPEAGRWFRRGWELGDLKCKIEVGKEIARDGDLTGAAEYLMAGAELGDIAVQPWVRLFEGIRRTLDEIRAWLESAGGEADAGEAVEALNEVRGYVRDYPGLAGELEGYYRKAAELGKVSALADLVVMWEECGVALGEGSAAHSELLRARELGYDGATYLIGLFAEQRGELAEAERWYTEAATAGHESSQWNLGVLCKRQRRLDEAERWFRAVGVDDSEVVGQLEQIHELRAGDTSERVREFAELAGLRARAESGDVRAGYEYGRFLYWWGGAAARQMIPWIRPAAEAGDAEAADVLAGIHRKLGEHTQHDRWRLCAAQGGDLDACFVMGTVYVQHYDFQEAERWFERAAVNGQGVASFAAGKLKAQRGAYTDAERLLRHAGEVGAGRDYALENTAYHGLTLHRLGRSAEALPMLRTAAARWHEVERLYARDDLIALSRVPDFAKEAADAEARV